MSTANSSKLPTLRMPLLSLVMISSDGCVKTVCALIPSSYVQQNCAYCANCSNDSVNIRRMRICPDPDKERSIGVHKQSAAITVHGCYGRCIICCCYNVFCHIVLLML